MRLLLATDYYPPLIGGATRAAEQLATRMQARGETVTVATSWQRGLPAREVRGGVEVIRLRSLMSRVPGASADATRYTPPPFPDPELTWRLRRLLAAKRPQVVHTYGWISYALCAALGRKRPPLILSARDYGNVCPKRTLVRHGQGCDGPAWGKCLACAPEQYGAAKGAVATAGILGGRRLLRRKLSALHSCSGYVEKIVEEDLLSASQRRELRRVVIPDFRDEALESAPSHEPAGLPGEPFILYVGALREVKGVPLLLDAYERLPSPRPPLVLIGGRTPDTPASFPAGVTVLHDLPQAEVMAAWERALFGVAPSVLHEPLGNVVHEAMSRGKPVIGTSPGGHGDMIESGVSGLLVPAGDGEALLAAMKALLADRAGREAMGAVARLRAERFTEAAVFPQFVRLYEEEAAGSEQTSR